MQATPRVLFGTAAASLATCQLAWVFWPSIQKAKPLAEVGQQARVIGKVHYVRNVPSPCTRARTHASTPPRLPCRPAAILCIVFRPRTSLARACPGCDGAARPCAGCTGRGTPGGHQRQQPSLWLLENNASSYTRQPPCAERRDDAPFDETQRPPQQNQDGGGRGRRLRTHRAWSRKAARAYLN